MAARTPSSPGTGHGLDGAFTRSGGKSDHVKDPGDVAQSPADTHTVASGFSASGIDLANGTALLLGGVTLGAIALRRRSVAQSAN
ncbi:hypothetical protein ACIGXM_03475 [Kitasatospora sp. NPDC052896]|uniref:hypothetical protein n=1 Tax=Kitasatospora sp. NPDC052896 TaxID=3364061 RepID=UPI0037C66C94